MHVHQAGNHLALALTYRRHVDFRAVLLDSQFLTSSEVRSKLRAMDDILARKAGDVGAGASYIFSLNDSGLHALFRQGPGQEFAGGSTTQHQEVVSFRF